MNVIAMLERCAKHQYEPGPDHTTYLQPEALWREQETLEEAHPLSCED